MAKYTIRDIARLAGVSRSTVSLVLNDSPSVNRETRRRVLEVIEEVGYRPSAQARGLAQRRARTMALIVPESDEVYRNFYLADTVAGILEALTPRGYKLALEPATREFLRERAYDILFQEHWIDGALVVGARVNDEHVARMRDARYPICFVNCDIEGAARVIADNLEGAKMAARHLAALGHVDIGYIRGPDNLTTGRHRHAGFLEAMDEMGLELRAERCAFGVFSEYSGYEAMGKILRQAPVPPTALFAASDMMALGAIHRLKEAGFEVPRDVAVVGADDILLSSYSSPTLTTVRQSLTTIGRRAAELLMERLETGESLDVRETVSAPLVIRESCGAQSRPI